MDFNDALLYDIQNDPFADYDFSSAYNETDFTDRQNDSFSEKGLLSADSKKDLIHTTVETLAQIDSDSADPSLFPAAVNTFGNQSTDIAIKPVNITLGSSIMDSNQSLWSQSRVDFRSLFEIKQNSPAPPLPPCSSIVATTTVNPSDILPMPYYAQQENATQTVKIETAEVGPSRQWRKSVPASGNIQPSPMTFQSQNEESVDLQRATAIVKTEVQSTAMVSLNGTEGRSRQVGASSTPTTLAVASSSNVKHGVGVTKNGKVKSKRKYEMDDAADPSVKNAKAAKMNRDKKKMQMAELKKKVDELTDKNDDLQEMLDIQAIDAQQMKVQHGQEIAQRDQEIAHRDQEIYQLRQLLQSEQGKNSANSKQKVIMLDLIKSVVSVVIPTPTEIYVTERLATTPMPDPSEMDQIRNDMEQVAAPSGNSMDSYLTFKVGIGGTPSIAFDCENKPQQ